ncbi:Predicted 2-oxoglutarate-and Fe(II)-dependent dioxygenase YbiX [Aquimarina amphilecti]|uniref:Predicted 2-oxoglutarate-and Fe(II)-dependent dioxygenase YbiX n=1 Tax=Aquimarina amphilecti TaxID=1038014 RepID=A0A1H7THM3_AQUAM|nr:2OG-Fe(II) oxygenase [Aquimarina amphilecti]SEL84402.1 Predicted 2-oxoglutarate-and Fe(II)-dependent dioxygenase YbiX [Aquimarina amphilecti]
MIKNVLHPEIFLIEDFLSKEMCNHFIEKGEQVSFEEAKVSIDGKQVMVKGVRNNQRILFKDQLLADKIWEKLEPNVIQNFGIYKANGLNEMFRVYKYEEGQRFKMHRDGSYKRNEKECSFFSFLIYLNEDFEGGETFFENGVIITPSLGDALLFHHPLRHEGKPITSGTKYVLRTDIMYKLTE